MRKLKILLYGDVDLNFIDGSSVWLTSMARMLAESASIQVDVLLKAKIKETHLISEMDHLENIRLIDVMTTYKEFPFNNRNRMSASEAVKIIKQQDHTMAYHLIITRGLDLVTALLDEEEIAKKTIPYITNFEHQKNKVSSKERQQLKAIYRGFPKLFMQTDEMKKSFMSITREDGQKIELLYPMIPNIVEQPLFENTYSQLVYSGKFAKDWYVEEMLDIADSLIEEKVRLKVAVAGNKFQDDLGGSKERMIERFNQAEHVTWHGGVSREKGQRLIAESDLGYGFRSIKIDNDESVELSTKLLEYARLGKPVLCRPTKLHKELLGSDYPLFVTSKKECTVKIREAFTNPNLYEMAAEMAFDAVQMFTFKASYQRLSPVLWSFMTQPIRLLVAGHDFKFLQQAMKSWGEDPQFEVKVDQWQGHNQHEISTSQALLDWADVIFCEWGLGNSVWYSKQKHPDQKLIVRMHAQEVNTVYPSQLEVDNIDKIITVSPYINEVFSHKCQLPREKMTMIYNMIETEKYDLPKDKETLFHLGLVGILPKSKRLDIAIDIIEELVKRDSRYKLFIRSKMPTDLPWMKNRPEEMAYYEKQLKRVSSGPLKHHVFFDKHGGDMEKWFKKIGIVLSTSDNESFHLAPMEGMASEAFPCVINWEGAHTIYPQEVIKKSSSEMVTYIESLHLNQRAPSDSLKDYPHAHFNTTKIIKELNQLIVHISQV